MVSPLHLDSENYNVFCERVNGRPFPPLENLPNPGIESSSPVSPTLLSDSLPLIHQGSPKDGRRRTLITARLKINVELKNRLYGRVGLTGVILIQCHTPSTVPRSTHTAQNASPAPASPTSGGLRQVNTIELEDRPRAKQGLSAPFSR